VSGINIHDLLIDGSSGGVPVATSAMFVDGAVNFTATNITQQNFINRSNLLEFMFNGTFTNITQTKTGCVGMGMLIYDSGNLQFNGLTISGATGYPACNNSGGDGSGGMGISQTAGSTFTNVTIDKSGTTNGRPFKIDAASYNTFNNLVVENGPNGFNGISIEYYSSHNTFNSPIVRNNASCNGCGGAGINGFGNFNQYNTFNTPTITGNGNVQVYHYVLNYAQDSNWTISGGTIGGSGTTGLLTYGANGCVNNNTFQSGMSAGIQNYGAGTLGSGNTMNGNSSNLTSGTCGSSGTPASPTGLQAVVQ
jgi:hypothetical protein